MVGKSEPRSGRIRSLLLTCGREAGHVAAEARIGGAIRFTHSAGANLCLNAIVRDDLRNHGLPLRAIL